jgi:hypothetical protein
VRFNWQEADFRKRDTENAPRLTPFRSGAESGAKMPKFDGGRNSPTQAAF